MISDTFWRRRFGAELVLGRHVLLNGTDATIVGVADASLAGSFVGAPIDVWVPIETAGRALGPGWDVDRSKRTLSLIGRLRRGVTAGDASRPAVAIVRRGMTILVRSSDAPDRMMNAVQGVLQGIDPNLQGFFSRTLAEHVSVSTLPVRLAARLTTVVAALALGLAVVGLYSLVLFLVAERTPEIGVRMALGSDARDVLRLVLGYGLKLGLALLYSAASAANNEKSQP